MKQHSGKRILSLFLALVMLFTMCPVTVFASGDHSVTVGFTVVDCVNGCIEWMRTEVTATPGLAAKYLDGTYGGGYSFDVTVGENDVTPIDVLVAAHLEEYGDDFTDDTAEDYIGGPYGDFSYISKMFGEETDIMFMTNGFFPAHEETGYGYAINQYIVQDDDEIYFYRIDYSADPASIFATFDKSVNEIEAGEELTLNLRYCPQGDYSETTYPAPKGVEICELDEDGKRGGKIAETDENGNVTVSFKQAGTYYLTCSGTILYYDDMWMTEREGAFSPAYCKIIVTASEPATYEVIVKDGKGSGDYAEGDSVTITANEAPEGKRFKEWTGTDGLTFIEGSKTTATATFTMPAKAVEVTATYEDIPVATYAVTVTNGTGSGSYVEGASVTITANDAPDGQRFKEWQGADGLPFTEGSKTTATTTFTMPAEAVEVTATYEDIPVATYAVTVTNGEGSGDYAEGESVTITANEAPEGKRFKEWQGADALVFTTGSKTTATATFTMPAEAVEVTATYEDIPAVTYAVTVTNGEGSGDYAEGESVTITADEAPEGKRFKEWTGADGLTFTTGSKTTATATFTMPAEAVEVTATYEDIPVVTYGVTVTNGTGSGDYAEGASVTIAANEAPEGQRFKEWTGTDGLTFTEGSKTTATATFTMPAEAVEVTATYEDIPTWQEVLDKTESYFIEKATESAPKVGSTFGEWLVLGLARNGVSKNSDYFNKYYNNVVTHVQEKIKDGRLSSLYSTENSRVILGLTSLGKSVTDVGGHNLLSGLNDMSYISKQGVNGTIWTLIAFDSGEYDIPAPVTREALVNELLSQQKTDGYWGNDPSTVVDMTGMALQALAPYVQSNAKVETAVNKALNWLSAKQLDDGSYPAGRVASSESVAQVLTALCALEIDCTTDSRFIKNGISVLDALLAFAQEDGRFRHGKSGGANQMSTEQAFYALVAYDRFQSGKNRLYDMTDAKLYTITAEATEKGTVTPDKNSAYVGDRITVTVSANAGYQVKGLTMNGTALTANAEGNFVFTMPKGDVVLCALFESLGTVIEQETTKNEAENSATVTVTESAVNAALDAVKNQSSAENKVVTIIPTETGSADKVEVKLPATSIDKIAAEQDVKLTVQAPVATVQIPNAILHQMKMVSGDAVSITVENQDQEHIKDAGIAADTTGAVIVEITLQKGDQKVTNFGSNKLVIYLPVSDLFALHHDYDVVVLSDDRGTPKQETRKGRSVVHEGKRAIRMEMEHLSTFVVLHPAVANLSTLMDALGTVTDAKQETYNKIEAIKAAYAQLSAAQKTEIKDKYDAFLAQAKVFEKKLNTLIKAAKDDLDDIFQDYKKDKKDYTDKNWKKLKKIHEEALAALDKALYAEAVEKIVKDAEDDMEDVPTGNEIEVTFRLIGDFPHKNGVTDHEEYVTWIETTDYTLEAGSTMYDLFMMAIEDADLSQKGAKDDYVESIKAPDCLGGYWLGEFDNGRNSGWMYTVNGEHPDVGLTYYEDLEDGDEVIWHYVDDYTKEERDSSSKYYERWLEADDISPEAYVEEIIGKIVTIGKHGKVKPALDLDDLGEDITFRFQPDAGYVVKDVIVDGKSVGAVESYTYEELEISSRIKVSFMPAEIANILLVGSHGTVQPELEWDDLGRDVIFTFIPDAGYVVSDVIIDGKSVGAVTSYSYKNLSLESRIQVIFAPATTIVFSDIPDGLWYSEAVQYVAANGFFSGTGKGNFSPNLTMSRAMLVTVLHNMAKNPTVSNANNFEDVVSGAWYDQAVRWAITNGITSGYGNGKFGTNDDVTREQIAVFLYNYAKLMGYDVSVSVNLTSYADDETVSGYAKTAMEWAVANNILSGRTGNLLAATSNASRAEVATMIYNFAQKIIG